MRNLLKKAVRRLGRHEAGFSLIEILVAIGIMAAIAAITVPLVSRFTKSGETGAKTTENSTLQTAMDAYMADASLSSVTAQSGSGTNSFSGSHILNPFLRTATTTYCYNWSTGGDITQKAKAATSGTACP